MSVVCMKIWGEKDSKDFEVMCMRYKTNESLDKKGYRPNTIVSGCVVRKTWTKAP